MSETFYIKKTAFDDTSNDILTREKNSFIIGPGELNGPGGLTRSSDLKLYGFGAANWGGAVDQNLFRILENNACPRKEVGDPGYDPINPKPKDEGDLGIGNGITSPIIGQNWFDTSADVTFTYTVSGAWTTVTTTDLDPSGELNMNSNRIYGLADPTTNGDAVNLGYANSNYVNVSGDIMTGVLTMASGDINMSGSGKVINLANATTNGDAVSRSFADSRYIQNIGGSITGNITFSSGGDIVMSSGSDISMSGSGKITGLDLNAPTSAGDVISRGRGDGRYLTLTGSNSMTGNILMNGNKITNLQNPSSLQDAATKAYVDSATSAITTYPSIITQSTNAASINIALTPGQWRVEAHARFHITAIVTAQLRIDGAIVDDLTGGTFADYAGTNFIPLFGFKDYVVGNRIITVNFTAGISVDFPRIMVTAIRVA